jgi:hypothetical protein
MSNPFKVTKTFIVEANSQEEANEAVENYIDATVCDRDVYDIEVSNDE